MQNFRNSQKEIRMPLSVGDVAPDFTVPSTDGSIVSLSSLKGSNLVLYFYPKDDTSGCTAEACSFRDNIARVQSHGAKLFGISPDGVKSHKKFTDKYELNFPLLADEDHAVAELYGVWVEKSMYGRKYMGIERTTFVIGADGTIKAIFHKVKEPGHTEEVLKALDALK